MDEQQKIIDALRNCVTEPKCKDCPWEDCERFDTKRVSVPRTLLLAVLRLLRERK